MGNEGRGKLVTVTFVNKPTEAAYLKTLFEDAGLLVFVQNEFMSQLYGGNSVGGIDIQVSESDVEKANRLLDEIGYQR